MECCGRGLWQVFVVSTRRQARQAHWALLASLYLAARPAILPPALPYLSSPLLLSFRLSLSLNSALLSSYFFYHNPFLLYSLPRRPPSIFPSPLTQPHLHLPPYLNSSVLPSLPLLEPKLYCIIFIPSLFHARTLQLLFLSISLLPVPAALLIPTPYLSRLSPLSPSSIFTHYPDSHLSPDHSTPILGISPLLVALFPQALFFLPFKHLLTPII